MRSFLLTLTFLCTSVIASAAEDGSQLTIEQWVSQDSHGNVAGRIVLPQNNAQMAPVDNVNVVITSLNGKVYRATEKTNANGEFSIANAPSGVYTLLARGKNVYACCALHVVAPGEVKVEKRHEIAEIAAANIDYTDIKTAIIRYMPPNVGQTASFEDHSAKKVMTSFDEEQAFRVAQSNGGMSGRLFQAGLNGDQLKHAGLSNIFVYQNGQAVAHTVSRMDGTFEFNSLDAGQYSLMSIGPDGLGITSFELIDQNELTARVTESGDERLVVLQAGCGCCPQFEMQIAPCAATTQIVEDVLLTEEVITDECGCGTVDPCGCGGDICCDAGIPIDTGMVVDPLATPSYGGGYGGGGGYYGGGGGGGFGGGGFGGIAGLAGLGIGIAALASDDDNAIIVPTPVSPASP